MEEPRADALLALRFPGARLSTNGSAHPVQCQRFPGCHFNLGLFAERKMFGSYVREENPQNAV